MSAPDWLDGGVVFPDGFRCPHCDYKTACGPCFNHHGAKYHSGPRSVPSPHGWTRAVVGEDAYCELLDTIDPGAEQWSRPR